MLHIREFGRESAYAQERATRDTHTYAHTHKMEQKQKIPPNLELLTIRRD